MSLIRTTNSMGQRLLITSHAVSTVAEAGVSLQYNGIRCVIRLLDGRLIESRDTYQTIIDQMAATPEPEDRT